MFLNLFGFLMEMFSPEVQKSKSQSITRSGKSLTRNSGFKFSARSLNRLEGVHDDLLQVCHLALAYSEIDFAITEGLRSMRRQHELFAEGSTKTMNSRHLTGHAVDVMAYVDGKGNWDMKYYRKIEKAFREASKTLDVDITWGGNWKSFKDGCHFQLAWKSYKV